MSKKPQAQGATPSNLPDNFFDSNNKSKKEREDDLAKELEQFEREMAALEAESEEHLREEFEKLQEDKNLDELDHQMEQWKRIVDLEKRAEQLKNKPLNGNPKKKFKKDFNKPGDNQETSIKDPDVDLLDNIEDFEDKLFNWRSKGL